MNTNQKIVNRIDLRAMLSTLWIFLALNYIYCDHLGLMEPEALQSLMKGQVGNVPVTQGFLFAAAIILEISFVMVVLSRVLPYRANRWANIAAGLILTIIQVGTMGLGTAPTPVYLFYSVIEVAVNLLIVWLAWQWKKPETDSVVMRLQEA